MKDATEGTNIQLILIGDHHDHNCISFETMLKDQGDIIDGYVTSPDSVVVLPYSSGTTGVPKGVQLTHRNLVAQMEQLVHPEVKLVDMEQVTVCVLPLYHIFAMHVTMSNMLWNAGKLVTVPMFEPSMFLKTLVDYRPTTLHFAPPLVGFLANHPAVTPEHLASLNTIVVGAAPAGQALIDLFDKRAPNVRFRERYGMTEISPAVTFTRLQVEQTGGSCGQLLPNTNMKVLDLVTEEEKGPGETGELCLLWWDWFQLVSFLFKKIRHKVDLVKNTNSSFLRIGGPIQFWSLYRNAIKFYSEGIDTNNTLVRTVTGEMDK